MRRDKKRFININHRYKFFFPYEIIFLYYIYIYMYYKIYKINYIDNEFNKNVYERKRIL